MMFVISFGDLDYLLLFFSLAGLCPGPVFDCLYVDHVVFLLGVVSLGMLCFYEDKLGCFGVVLDSEFFVLPFFIDL